MDVQWHEKAVMPQGFVCASRLCGLKTAGKDLAVFYSQVPAQAAGLFTRNHFPGAPITVGRQIIQSGVLQAIIVNSKVSNVGTGPLGIQNAHRMAEALARELDLPAERVLMSSTGVIGRQLPIGRIEEGVRGIAAEFCGDPLVGAEGIMTTDTHPKALSVAVDRATLTIVAKGAGMIAPNMATMLVYLFTDAAFSAKRLDRLLRTAAAQSFQMLSVDSDTSTSDTCIIMANGMAGEVEEQRFAAALNAACVRMVRLLARDGEGATKLLIAKVLKARSEKEARIIAKAVVESPLIKTMAYGADPNVGRIIMAIGKCVACEVQPQLVEIAINATPVFGNGQRLDFDEMAMRRQLGGEEIEIVTNLNVGSAEATAYGCDLTEGYIKENAAYYSS